LPGLADRAELTRWLKLQLDKLDVDIRLNFEGTAQNIKELSPDVVLVSTGARYSRSGVSKNQLTALPGAEQAHVLIPEDIILDGAAVGDKVLVYDNTAYEVGPGIAEYLADQGKSVTLVTMDSAMAMSVTELDWRCNLPPYAALTP
jgi:hypothetical protein